MAFFFGPRRHRHRRRRSPWGFAPPPRRHRRSSYWGTPQRGYHPMRRQSRSNVRVVGCCLPIPIGFVLTVFALRSLIGARISR